MLKHDVQVGSDGRPFRLSNQRAGWSPPKSTLTAVNLGMTIASGFPRPSGRDPSIVSFIGRRRRLAAHELEEFAAHVNLKLIEDDYAVFRKFEGRSSLRTYLTVVVQRCFSIGVRRSGANGGRPRLRGSTGRSRSCSSSSKSGVVCPSKKLGRSTRCPRPCPSGRPGRALRAHTAALESAPCAGG